jgi:hypothetical protein
MRDHATITSKPQAPPAKSAIGLFYNARFEDLKILIEDEE